MKGGDTMIKHKQLLFVLLLLWFALMAGGVLLQSAAIVADSADLHPLATGLSGASAACHQMTGLACRDTPVVEP